MDNQFLIPANSKKSQLYFGLFELGDLIMFAIGVAVSLILLMVLPLTSIVVSVIALAPGVVTGFLVMPVPNYYNMRTLLKTMFVFFTSRQKYIWKGWGFLDGEESNKK